MDDFDVNNLTGDEDIDRSIPLDEDPGPMKVSHAPLNLGGGGTTPAPVSRQEDTGVPKSPVGKPVASTGSKQTVEKSAQIKGSATDSIDGRITGVKTFFTKLHAGAMEFQDEQITKWLQDNPDVYIKLTNTTTGEVQGKKTEPNIIISVWYYRV
jgi:hypothetical protein